MPTFSDDEEPAWDSSDYDEDPSDYDDYPYKLEEICVKKADSLPPLHAACFKGDINELEIILKNQNIDVSEPFEKEYPLHFAAKTAFVELDQYKLIHRTEYVQTIDLLLQRGAQVNVRDGSENTPLHLVCMKTTNYMAYNSRYANEIIKKIVKLLVAYNASVKVQNNIGDTPLHCSWENNCVVKILLLHGADITIRNLEGEAVIEKIRSYSIREEDKVMYYINKIEKMKSIQLNDVNSLYDILFLNASVMERYIDNDIFKQVRNEGTYSTDKFGDFYEYRDEFEEKYLIGLQRKNGKEDFAILTGQLRIPDLCYEELFKYFNKYLFYKINKANEIYLEHESFASQW